MKPLSCLGLCDAGGRWQHEELAGFNLQWRANSNPGTMGRAKSSHILRQQFLLAHPSNPQWAVTTLNSSGTTHQPAVSCYFVPFAYTVSPVHPRTSDFGLFPAKTINIYCLCWSFPLGSRIFWTKRKQTRSWLVTFSSTIKDKHQKDLFWTENGKITCVCMSIYWHQCF